MKRILFLSFIATLTSSCLKSTYNKYPDERCGGSCSYSFSYILMDSSETSYFHHPLINSPLNTSSPYFLNGIGEKTSIEIRSSEKLEVIFEIRTITGKINSEARTLESDSVSWLIYYPFKDDPDTLLINTQPSLPSFIKYNSQVLFDRLQASQNVEPPTYKVKYVE